MRALWLLTCWKCKLKQKLLPTELFLDQLTHFLLYPTITGAPSAFLAPIQECEGHMETSSH